MPWKRGMLFPKDCFMIYKPPHVLLLGGSGFLGAEILKELKSTGHRITAIQNYSPIPDDNIQIIHSSLNQINWNILDQLQPDIIIHSARIPGKNRNERKEFSNYGALANQKLISKIENMNKKPRLIYVSGSLVYGSHKLPVTENIPANPVGFQREYSIAEEPFLKALANNNHHVNVVRPGWILGNGSWLKYFYFDQMSRKSRIPVFGNGKNTMSIIHVQDCARLIIHLAANAPGGKLINLKPNYILSQIKFASILKELSGCNFKKSSKLKLQLRYGKAIREAFTFSLHMQTEYEQFLNNFDYLHHNLKADLKEFWETYKTEKTT